MNKKKKNDFAPHIPSENAPRCEANGCMEEGLYKAPRSRQQLNNYHYFCLEHVREHNKKWDYFSGMSPDEIERFMHDAVTGHRPTWERETKLKNPADKLYAALDEFLVVGRRKTKPLPQLSPKMRKAVALFELNYPYTEQTLKSRYKQLVKTHHPDRNPGDKLAEEKFKAITVAFGTLKQHISLNETL